MKVLMINGSAHENGCTATALKEMARVLRGEGIESEIVCLGGDPVRDCTGCGACSRLNGRCVHDDDMVNALIDKARACEGFVFGTPVYYAHPSGRLLSVLDRMFYAASDAFRGKVGAAVVSARRAGTTASLDAINKYFGISGMPVAGSTYWGMVHGGRAEDVLRDEEGLQTMRNLARNMAYMMKSAALARENGLTAPDMEKGNRTNFIR